MEFTIVRVRKPRKERGNKYVKLLEAMSKLRVNDYIVVFPNSPENRVVGRTGNIKQGLKRYLNHLPRRSFECTYIRAEGEGATGYDVIVRRTK